MDWYLLFKFLHVVFAIAWLGSGLGLVVLGISAERANDDAELLRVLRNGMFLATRILVPASTGAVIAGIVMVVLGQSWTDIWIIIGLLGFIATFSFGNFFIKPRGDRMLAMADKDGPSPAVAAQCRDILAFIKFDVVMLFTVVADMVLKPHAGDWPTLAVMALVVIGAWVVILGRRSAPRPARV